MTNTIQPTHQQSSGSPASRETCGSCQFMPGDVKYSACIGIPEGWLQANGQQISRVDYPELFAAIGTTYGEGDGVSTFALPDLRGEFVRGFDDGRGVDAGRRFGSVQKGTLLPYDTTTSGVANGVWNLSTTRYTGPSSQEVMGVDAYSTKDYPTVKMGGVDASALYDIPGPASDTGYTGVVRPRNVALQVLIKY